MFTSLNDILTRALKNRYAIGYFESWNLESARAVAKSAEEKRSPLIVGFNGGFIEKYKYQLEHYASIANTIVSLTTVPAVSLLNEIASFEQVIRAIRAGFSAIMIDVSAFPFEKAIKLTRKVVRLAHLANVHVEAQFDKLPCAKNGRFKKTEGINMTEPKKAKKFVEETCVDALSISIGNVHGLYEESAKLDYTRLQEIKESIETPLVLHGGTGISDNDVKRVIELGVCKINVGHILRLLFSKVVKNELEKGIRTSLEEIFNLAEEEMKNLIKNKIEIYGSAGRV
jgi:ketose-bisphosphate aldolase